MPDEPASPKDAPLTPAEQDVATAAAAADVLDPLLESLAGLGDASAGTAVGLLVNGMVIFGALSSAEPMAEQIDRQLAQVADWATEALKDDEQDLRGGLDRLRTLAHDQVAAAEKRRSKLETDAKPYLTDDGFAFDAAPAELSRRVIQRQSRRFLTLRDVQIYAPAQAGVTRVPVMRVAATDISGWWIVPVDQHGSASFQLWSESEGPAR